MSKLEIGLLVFTVIENVATYFYWRRLQRQIKAYRATEAKYQIELNNFAGWRNTF